MLVFTYPPVDLLLIDKPHAQYGLSDRQLPVPLSV